MPTRYTASDISFDKMKINKEILKDPGRRKKIRRIIKRKLQERCVDFFMKLFELIIRRDEEEADRRNKELQRGLSYSCMVY